MSVTDLLLSKLLSYPGLVIKGSSGTGGYGVIEYVECGDFRWNCASYNIEEGLQSALMALIEYNAKASAIEAIKKEMWGIKE